MIRNAEFGVRLTAASLRRVFLPSQFLFVQGPPGGGSVWHVVQTIRDPRWAPPWHWEVHRKTGVRRGV